MSFELRQDQSIRKNIRRIVRKQLEGAKEALCDESPDSALDERIHSARKGFKRVRAVVRLVRYSIGESNYRMENESLRNAGRPLSEVRDAKVLIDALDKLQKRSGNAISESVFAEIRKDLCAQKRDVLNRVVQNGKTFEETAKEVQKAIKRLDDWSRTDGNWKPIGEGVRTVYSQGRKAFDQVKTEPAVERLHEWRKQVKYLRHHLELLAPAWPEVVGELATQAEELGELLGEDHDLAVLGSHDVVSKSTNNRSNLDLVAALIKARREAIQKQAIPKGELLYRDPPKQFVRRLRSYWRKWEKRAKHQAAVA